LPPLELDALLSAVEEQALVASDATASANIIATMLRVAFIRVSFVDRTWRFSA
jgi:hypothetical protein